MIYDHVGIIKYQIDIVDDSRVEFEVLWQNPRLRRESTVQNAVKPVPSSPVTGQVFGVQSNLYPEIGPAGTHIYIQGSEKRKDSHRSSKSCGTDEAFEFAQKLHRSLEAWVQLPIVAEVGIDWKKENGLWTLDPQQLSLFE